VQTAPLSAPESAPAEALDNACPTAYQAFASSNYGAANVPASGLDRRHIQSPPPVEDYQELQELQEPDVDLITA
jgi:hypothetical protein